MRKGVLPVVLLAIVLLLGSWTYSLSSKTRTGISAVKAILVQNCALAGCHRASVSAPAANLDLGTGRFPGSVLDVPSSQIQGKLVDTKSPEKSYLLAKIKGTAGIVGDRMPLNRTPLNDTQIQEVETWINSLKSQ
jgi:hypothetical protein